MKIESNKNKERKSINSNYLRPYTKLFVPTKISNASRIWNLWR